MNKLFKKLIIKLYWKHCYRVDIDKLHEYYNTDHWHGAEVIRCINSYNTLTPDNVGDWLHSAFRLIQCGKIVVGAYLKDSDKIMRNFDGLKNIPNPLPKSPPPRIIKNGAEIKKEFPEWL